ncbi:MAG: PIN domain-containing protein [Bryobacteraceae bacterium]
MGAGLALRPISVSGWKEKGIWEAKLVKSVRSAPRGDRLRLSTQVLQELFVTLTRKVRQPCSSEEALAVLEDLTAWPLMVVDYTAIRAAVRLAGQARLSFCDALVVVAAVRAGAAVLYTEDLNHGQEILGVRISNPFLPGKPE